MTANSLYALTSFTSRLHSRSLSAKPTSTCKPLGWNETLNASSTNVFSSSRLMSR